MIRSTALAAALVAGLAAPAAAQLEGEVPEAAKTWIGGQLFSDFSVPTTPFAPQAFEIKRARIYGNAAFNKTWSGAIVYNVRAVTFDCGGKASTDA
jgi:hypothetical protein